MTTVQKIEKLSTKTTFLTEGNPQNFDNEQIMTKNDV